MINIVFLLLIFFMLAGKIHSRNAAVIPPVATGNHSLEAKSAVLEISREGLIFWRGDEYSFADMETITLIDQQQIAIRADEKLQANRFLKLLEFLQKNNVKNIHLVIREATD